MQTNIGGWRTWELRGREEGKNIGARGVKGIRIKPIEPSNLESKGLTETESATRELTWD